MLTSAEVVYLDSSALVKLAVEEPETAALRRHLRHRGPRVSCAIARVEVVRAVRRHRSGTAGTARAVLAEIDLVAVDDVLLDAAAELAPLDLRSLDAIHVAAAMALGGRLEAVVTYDDRMRAAAIALGLPVVSPR